MIQVLKFGKKGRLKTRFVGLFEIFDKIGLVAYKLALSLTLVTVHNVFHIFIP